MKKILAGCLIVAVIAMIGFGVAAFYAYRAMKPVIDNASDYMDKAREVARLGEEIKNKTPYEPPTDRRADGDAGRALPRRAGARAQPTSADQWAEIEKKSADIKARPTATARTGRSPNSRASSPRSATSGWPRASRRSTRSTSSASPTGIRAGCGARVYEAAGVELAGGHGPFEDRRPGARECRPERRRDSRRWICRRCPQPTSSWSSRTSRKSKSGFRWRRWGSRSDLQ